MSQDETVSHGNTRSEVNDSGEDWGDVTTPFDVQDMLEAHLPDLVVGENRG